MERPALPILRSLGGDPAADLLAEEALVRGAADRGPALLLYGWDRPVLVLGYGQDPATVDLAACRARGVPVLRRITGGTGVVHGRDLAATLALPPDHPWARSIPGLHDRFVDALAAGLASLGIATTRPPRPAGPRPPRSPICFEDDWGETLAAEARKAVGCAQARRREGVLVHGVALLGVDAGLQGACYGVAPARITAALGPVADPPPAREALADALARALADALGLEPAPVDRVAPPPGLAGRYEDPRWAPVRF